MASMDVDWGSVGSGALTGAGTGATIGSMFGPVGAGIGAGAGALVGGISGYFDSKDAKEEQIEAEQRASNEWEKQQQMLNEEYDRRVADERAYNDPTAQATRLKQAGINPLSSMTTGGAVASNTAGTTGTASAQIPTKSAMSDIIALQSLRNESAVAQSQVALNIANAKKITNDDTRAGEMHLEEIIGKRLANELSEIDLALANATFEDKVALSAETLNQMRSAIAKLNEEREYLVKQGKIADKELDVMDAKIAEYESVVLLNDAKVKDMANRLEFDKQVEERIKSQGLSGLRIESAKVAVEKSAQELRESQFDWNKFVDMVELDLKEEGMDIDWGSLGKDVLNLAIGAASAAFLANKAKGVSVAYKSASSIFRRVLRTKK